MQTITTTNKQNKAKGEAVQTCKSLLLQKKNMIKKKVFFTLLRLYIKSGEEEENFFFFLEMNKKEFLKFKK